MCSGDPDMPSEANRAKCFVIACFVFSIFSMIGFFAGWPGIIGGVCGILACVAASILMCCAPKKGEGACKFTAAGALLLIAGIIQIIMAIALIVITILLVTAVQKIDTCADGDHWKANCVNKPDDGTDCTADIYYGSDAGCYKSMIDDDDDSWDDGDTWHCAKSDYPDTCEDLGNAVKTGFTVLIVVVSGISIAFEIIAGVLNVIGGAYCLKAKIAIEKVGQGGASLTTTTDAKM